MALRLIEMVLHEEDSQDVVELLKDHELLEHRQIHLSNQEILVRILLDAEKSETILDLLEKRFAGKEGSRVMILPVEATVPRAEKPEEEKDVAKQAPEEKMPERIGREELYEDIKDAAKYSRIYLTMAALATLLAAAGLYYNNATIIIGAMVIAPSMGPSIALAFGTVLGDLKLMSSAFLSGLAGIAVSIVLSVLIGTFLEVNPELSEVASRARINWGNIVVALASGCAGSLAFTTAISATLIGVMVAVALLPPLVNFGLLLGSGEIGLALGALSLFSVNVICVNLASVTTFLVLGIRPISKREQTRAGKITHIAIWLWVIMLLGLAALIMFLQRGII